MSLIQTVTLDIGCTVTDISRRNEFSASVEYSTGGNFTRQDALLQPGGVDAQGATLSLPVPSQAIYIMTAGPNVALQVTWTINSTPVVMSFKINNMFFLADMTNITNLELVNNEVTGSTPETVRILLF